MDAVMDNAITDALECFRSCSETLTECMDMGGDHADPAHLNSLIDCAKACGITAEFLIRDSNFSPEMCALCADICEECAQSCEAYKDEFTKSCAKQCRQCAKSCREMVSSD